MPANILIVEDEMLVAIEMEAILEDLGHRPIGIAADLAAAETYAGEQIDLALVDLNLRDGLTGPQIGRMLCDKGTKVVFVTANPRLLGDGIAGAVGVITKPTDEDTLRQAVDYALGTVEKPPAALRLFG
ncbi:response regulator [Sphingomonas sp. LY29]|uniref:response regulator n=1 Tax=Sphingomonas sp. LY29 TaxID=3095341 RepID=UPI002D768326|nr:response regulator [Sphingomonas sp. LY29]WRP26579.1 response regulator [Sphingomonas sp. LY29]